MKNSASTTVIRILRTLSVTITALTVPACILFACFSETDFWAQAVLNCVFAVLTSSALYMSAELYRSVKKTLYDYKNIMLVGGILFNVAFMAVMAVFFLGAGPDGFSARDVYAAMVAFPRRFSYGAVFVFLVICVTVGISNVALMRHEGFRPRNALSVLLTLFYIGGTLAVYRISDLLGTVVTSFEDAATVRLLTALHLTFSLFLLLLLCYFECIFIGSAVMGFAAARRIPRHDKDFIIILGCRIDKKGGLLPLLKGRVNRAIRFAWEQEIETGKPVRYIPSGGQGQDEVMSEGSAMELYLLTRGAESDEVFAEKKSRNTYENMLCSKQIIDRLKPGAEVAFATTNYHILRSGILARRAGLDAEGIAGDTKWYFWPNGFIREFIGILAMHKKIHFSVAAVFAVLCVILGAAEYFGI